MRRPQSARKFETVHWLKRAINETRRQLGRCRPLADSHVSRMLHADINFEQPDDDDDLTLTVGTTRLLTLLLLTVSSYWKSRSSLGRSSDLEMFVQACAITSERFSFGGY